MAALLVATTGCASHAKNPADPLEPFNRGMYQFNDAVDKVALKPAAIAYNAVMPAPGKNAISNFFSNLNDLITTFNDLLQFKFAQAASDGSRFLFNSTFGVLGFFDVADRLEKHNEDFGQTLGYWGVGSGPYLVLPIFGPSSLRDAAGLYGDSFVSAISNVDHVPTRNELYVAKAIDTRTRLLDKEQLVDEAAMDKYAFIRDSYLQYRQNMVYDGDPPREKLYEDEAPEETKPLTPAPQSEIIVPSIRLVKEGHVNEMLISAASVDVVIDKKEPNSVHDVWLAQRNGIR